MILGRQSPSAVARPIFFYPTRATGADLVASKMNPTEARKPGTTTAITNIINNNTTSIVALRHTPTNVRVDIRGSWFANSQIES